MLSSSISSLIKTNSQQAVNDIINLLNYKEDSFILAIKYWVEGPKGSGKTTVLKKLQDLLDGKTTADDQFSYHRNVQIKHFGGHDSTLQGDILQQLQVSPVTYLVDRGYLSSIIYGWLGSVQPEFKITQNFGKWQVEGWTQFEQNQFKLIIDHIKGNAGAYIVFYASNPVDLADRLVDRHSNMNQSEADELLASNSLHRAYGKMLQDLYLDQYPIIIWDISSSFTRNLISNQLVLHKFFGYRSFASFNWQPIPLMTALFSNAKLDIIEDVVPNTPSTKKLQHQEQAEWMEFLIKKQQRADAVEILKQLKQNRGDN